MQKYAFFGLFLNTVGCFSTKTLRLRSWEKILRFEYQHQFLCKEDLFFFFLVSYAHFHEITIEKSLSTSRLKRFFETNAMARQFLRSDRKRSGKSRKTKIVEPDRPETYANLFRWHVVPLIYI